jgi:hypothetical protein
MARHKRRTVGPLVRRSTYLSLWRQYRELSAAYAALEHDHQGVLEDRVEEPLDLELPGRYVVPAWAETEPIPVITMLDTDKATALTYRSGMLRAPGGAWNGTDAGNNG